MASWNSDAQLATNLNDIGLYKSPEIRSFLETPNSKKFIIVSSKGMGKTLLMRHKSAQIREFQPSVLMIPRGEQADYVEMPASVDKTMLSALRDEIFWEDLWKASLMISMILHQSHDLSESDKMSTLSAIRLAHLNDEVRDLLIANFSSGAAKNTKPSTILSAFLISGKSRFEKFRTEGLKRVSDLFDQSVMSSCAVFVDSLDQGLNKRFPNNLEIWCAGQLGLMKAAWEITRHNRHARIYATIRQEAFASSRDPEMMNMKGSILLIRYTKRDLEQIFLTALRLYEGETDIAALLGFGKIYNGFLKLREDAFDYLERHTMGVPRWLMVLGEKLSNLRPELGLIADETQRRAHAKLVANTVNEEASSLARTYLDAELRPFFSGADPIIELNHLLKHVQSTVLTMANLSRLNSRYQSESKTPLPHPFCLLFNVGLLGHVTRSAAGTRKVQKFRRPYEFDWDYQSVLPSDPNTYFLLHPCLHHVAQINNHNFKYSKVRLGHDLTWTAANEKMVDKSRIRVFISYASADWATVERIVELMENTFDEQGIFADIWIDRKKMRAGKLFLDQMSQGIRESDHLVLMVSKNSLDSEAVQVEWKEKFRQGLNKSTDQIFPYVIDDSKYEDIPDFIKGIHTYRYNANDRTTLRLAHDIIFWTRERV